MNEKSVGWSDEDLAKLKEHEKSLTTTPSKKV